MDHVQDKNEDEEREQEVEEDQEKEIETARKQMIRKRKRLEAKLERRATIGRRGRRGRKRKRRRRRRKKKKRKQKRKRKRRGRRGRGGGGTTQIADEDTRIVNGYDPAERPWLALLDVAGGSCGGALLNTRSVLVMWIALSLSRGGTHNWLVPFHSGTSCQRRTASAGRSTQSTARRV